MTDPVQNVENSFVKAEPAVAAHLSSAVVGYVVTFLVLHGVVTSTQSSAVTQVVAPLVASVLLVALGFLVRRVVSPVAKFAERVEAAAKARVTAPVAPPAPVAVPAVPVAPTP